MGSMRDTWQEREISRVGGCLEQKVSLSEYLEVFSPSGLP